MAVPFNLYFVERLIIPDLCAYHNGEAETTAVFRLFYDIWSGAGYHPEASTVNYIVTMTMGAGAGWYLARLMKRKNIVVGGEPQENE